MAVRATAADSIVLMWDPNPPDEQVIGYVVSVAAAPGEYTESYDVGNQTFFVYQNAVVGQEYFFAVAAYDALLVGAPSQLSGFNNAPPSLVQPENQSSVVGEAVALQLDGSDLYGEPVTYAAAGLPPGLTLIETSGLIWGTGTASGIYTVSVTVSDGLLSTARVFTWGMDGGPPTVAITSPTTESTYSTPGATVALGGITSDDGGILAVTWVNNRGGSGTAIGTTTWTVPSVPLKAGENIVTVTVHDLVGFSATAVITVTSPGTPAPTVTITLPTSSPTYSTGASSTQLGGPVSDSTGIASVTWAIDHGGSGTAVVTSPLFFWSVPAVSLLPGLNVITVTARNASGNSSNAALTVLSNNPPILVNPGDRITAEGDGVSLQLAGSDSNGDSITYTVAGLPPGLTLDMSSGLISGTVPYTAAGVYSTTLAASDVWSTTYAFLVWTVTNTPLAVTPMAIAADKTYDGSRSTTLTCTVTGTLAGEQVACTGSAMFDTASAGAGKTVTVTNLALTGADAGNYALTTATATTTASIQQRTVTPLVTVADKPYDTTRDATITGCSVSPVVGGDELTCTATAAFDTASVGAAKVVTVTNIALTGADAGNYTLATTTTSTTAAIEANQLAVVTSPGAQTAVLGVPVTLAMAAVDPDGDTLTWSALNLPPGITIHAGTGLVTGTPTTAGTFAVVIRVSDGWDVVATEFLWSILLPLAGPASPLSPSGSIVTTTPAFSWSAIQSATYYALSIADASPVSPTVVWYTPAQAGCASGLGTCTVAAPRALTAGMVAWNVIAWNPAGYSPWSAKLTAIVELADSAVPPPAPAGPSGAIATRMPTYTWASVAAAIWYQLSVQDAAGTVREFWFAPAQACASACAATPNVLLASGPGQWKIRAWRVSGAGAWSSLITFDAVTSLPGKATPVSPAAAVATATPLFTWNAVATASYYLLRVTDRDNGNVERWYRPADAGCPLGTGTCAVSTGVAIKAGSANWKVLTWNGAGYGPWSDTREFLVEIADAAAQTPAAVSPTGAIVSSNAAYRWTAVAGALSYRLSIRNNGGAPIYWWSSPASAGCATAAECTALPQVALLNGAAEWQVQAWTASGFGPWSPAVIVAVNIPVPSASTLVAPSGTAASATPPFRWNASANANLYYVKGSDATGLRVNVWVTPAQVGCASGGVCTLNAGITLTSGAGSWQVIAWNPTGYSSWSSILGFVIP